MTLCKPCQTMRSCVFQHPPLLIFLLCLVTLMVSSLSLGLYIQTHTVRDADVAQDWDSFLHALSSLSFCPVSNKTGHDMSDSPSNTSELSNVSVLADLTIYPRDLVTNITGLRISVNGKQLGMKGQGNGAYIMVTVSPVVGMGVCNNSDKGCLQKSCITVTSLWSLQLESRLPPHCSMSNSSGLLPSDLYVAEQEPETPSNCYRAEYTPDPALQSMVSQDDRTLCSNRLLYAALSLLLFGSLVCLLAVCAQPTKDMRYHGSL